MSDKATISQIFAFFKTDGYNMAQFRADWVQLSDQDKTDIATGIGNGTLDY